MIALLILAFLSTALASSRLHPALITVDGHTGADSWIVNGVDVTPAGKYPWQGTLEAGSGTSWSHTCGCVFIGGQRVLTAAHCVEAAPTARRVRLGVHDRSSSTVGQPETFTVTTITRHPGWVNSGAQGFPNDIAVIIISSVPSSGNNFIGAATLPASGSDHTGQDCVISGWGRLSGGGILPQILQEASTNVITTADCQQRYGSIAPISDNHICIYTGNSGACNGDSGGPLVCRTSSGAAWQVAGLTSFGISGCNVNYPSVYTRTAQYRDFIDNN